MHTRQHSTSLVSSTRCFHFSFCVAAHVHTAATLHRIFLLPAAAGKPVPDAYWACRVGSLLAHFKASSLFIWLVADADLF
jgi:hypothetical protein